MQKQPWKILSLLLLSLLLSASVYPPAYDEHTLATASEPCGSNSQVSELIKQTSQEDWAGWIARLSGMDPVTINGEQTTIDTRFSYAIFRGEEHARAYEYVLERLRGWYPDGWIEEDGYPLSGGEEWKNIVLTLPGTSQAQEIVILSAHLDSNSQNPEVSAPGAEDNATGSAALLEAARIFRTARFERTLRLIWFTGEEQGLLGSKAYVRDHDLSGVVGVFNLDMFGYDANNDGCFELHIGTMKASIPAGACFIAAAQAYSPDLKVDAIDAYNMRFSDHNSFWEQGIGAVEVLENFSSGRAEDACGGHGEQSPYYHLTSDTLDKLNLDTGFAITRASLAAGAGLALPQETCFRTSPRLTVTLRNGKAFLKWTGVENADLYRIYRALPAGEEYAPLCSADWQPIHATTALSWSEDQPFGASEVVYRVEALNASGSCASAPSACATLKIPRRLRVFPWINP